MARCVRESERKRERESEVDLGRARWFKGGGRARKSMREGGGLSGRERVREPERVRGGGEPGRERVSEGD